MKFSIRFFLFGVVFCSMVGMASCQTVKTDAGLGKVPVLTEGQRIKKSNALLDLARSQLDQNANAEGLDLVNQALELDPENGNAYIMKGRAYRQFNRAGKALEAFELATKYFANFNETLINIAITYRDCGDLEKAQITFEKALKLNPNDAGIHREYGNYFRNQVRDYKSAVLHYELAVAQGNNDPWIYNDLSYAQEQLGNLDKAREYLHLAKNRIDEGQGDGWIRGQVTERLAKLK